MSKLIGAALFAAMTMTCFSSVSFAQTGQMDIQKLWAGSGYAHPGKGMRTMKMMHMMDADKDGKVTKDEFMHYYEMIWDKLDKNHKGYMKEEDWLEKQQRQPSG